MSCFAGKPFVKGTVPLREILGTTTPTPGWLIRSLQAASVVIPGIVLLLFERYKHGGLGFRSLTPPAPIVVHDGTFAKGRKVVSKPILVPPNTVFEPWHERVWISMLF